MQFPGSTYTSQKTAKLAARSRHIRRSKYISKRRENPISKRIYGKSLVAKLVRVTTGNISALTDWDTVYGLKNVLASSPDWTFYRDSYAMFNILNCTLKIYPQAFAFAQGIDRVAGVCYDMKDNAALSSLQSVADHLQHTIMNFSTTGAPCYVFQFKTKPIGVVPISTASNDENWGWIKAYGDNNDFGNVNASICRLEFIFTVAFSSEQ